MFHLDQPIKKNVYLYVIYVIDSKNIKYPYFIDRGCLPVFDRPNLAQIINKALNEMAKYNKCPQWF